MGYIKQRNILAVILLSIFTCGIYALYLFFAFYSELRNEAIANGIVENITTPLKAFLLIFITCGIYKYYYTYRASKVMEQLEVKKGYSSTEPVIVVIFDLFFGIGTFLLVYSANRYTKLPYQSVS